MGVKCFTSDLHLLYINDKHILTNLSIVLIKLFFVKFFKKGCKKSLKWYNIIREEVQYMKRLDLIVKCLKSKNYKWALCHLFNKSIFKYYNKSIIDIIK